MEKMRQEMKLKMETETWIQKRGKIVLLYWFLLKSLFIFNDLPLQRELKKKVYLIST